MESIAQTGNQSQVKSNFMFSIFQKLQWEAWLEAWESIGRQFFFQNQQKISQNNKHEYRLTLTLFLTMLHFFFLFSFFMIDKVFT